jgi:hypothetical protein
LVLNQALFLLSLAWCLHSCLTSISCRFSIVWTVTILIQWFFIAIGYMCNLFFDHLVFKTALLDAVKDSGNRMMVFDLFFQAAATPFGIIVLMLFYYDLRIRNEAFDVKLRAGIF